MESTLKIILIVLSLLLAIYMFTSKPQIEKFEPCFEPKKESNGCLLTPQDTKVETEYAFKNFNGDLKTRANIEDFNLKTYLARITTPQNVDLKRLETQDITMDNVDKVNQFVQEKLNLYSLDCYQLLRIPNMEFKIDPMTRENYVIVDVMFLNLKKFFVKGVHFTLKAKDDSYIIINSYVDGLQEDLDFTIKSDNPKAREAQEWDPKYDEEFPDVPESVICNNPNNLMCRNYTTTNIQTAPGDINAWGY